VIVTRETIGGVVKKIFAGSFIAHISFLLTRLILASLHAARLGTQQPDFVVAQ
jgi:hypothetical protein